MLSNECIPPADALTRAGIISGVLRPRRRTAHTGRLWDDFRLQIPTLCVTFSRSCNHSGNRMSNHLCKLFAHPEIQASSQRRLSQRQCFRGHRLRTPTCSVLSVLTVARFLTLLRQAACLLRLFNDIS